jgi:hypothetical protein
MDDLIIKNDKVTLNNNELQPGNMILKYKWNLWVHNSRDRNWSIDSYKKIFSLETIENLFQMVKNFEKLGLRHQHFFIMKDGILPTWEDENNRHGSTCSFRTELEYVGHSDSIPMIELWEHLLFTILGGTLFDDLSNINGLSLTPKNNWGIIKIWNKNNDNISNILKEKLDDKFNNLSIKHKLNIPEY